MVLAHRERLTPEEDAARAGRGADAGATPRPAQHPGPLPSPGVFARHNAVDTPALLPDGTVSELSVSATLRARGPRPSLDSAHGPCVKPATRP